MAQWARRTQMWRALGRRMCLGSADVAAAAAAVGGANTERVKMGGWVRVVFLLGMSCRECRLWGGIAVAAAAEAQGHGRAFQIQNCKMGRVRPEVGAIVEAESWCWEEESWADTDGGL